MTESFEEIEGTWDYASLPANIVIGRECWLERKQSFDRFRSIHKVGLKIGNRVNVFTWTTFNIEPEGHVQVGDDCILVGAVFMCAQSICIGDRVVISYNVTIADSDFHPINPQDRMMDAISNAPYGDKSQRPPVISRPVIIEDDVWIGIGVIILKGVHIGRGAKIEAGSIITSDVPAGTSVRGNPARPVEQ